MREMTRLASALATIDAPTTSAHATSDTRLRVGRPRASPDCEPVTGIA
jgi:hypothetical protein